MGFLIALHDYVTFSIQVGNKGMKNPHHFIDVPMNEALSWAREIIGVHEDMKRRYAEIDRKYQ